jgi:hypothetical protein
MKAYNRDRYMKKGLAGTRRSCDTVHRRRCLRVNKRGARQDEKQYVRKWGIDNYQPDDWRDW